MKQKIDSIFSFVDQGYDTRKTHYVYFHATHVHNEDDLLNGLFWCMGFPEYFGFNWNALVDCLGDFENINKEHIVLVHDGLPKISDDKLQIYLRILGDSVLFLRKDHPHCPYIRRLEVVFLGDGVKEKIVSLLKGYEL